MKNSSYYFLFLTLVLLSCENDDAAVICSDDPAEELAWLKAEIESYKAEEYEFDKYAWIKQAEYQHEAVFIFGNCCPTCSSIFSVKSCAGEDLGVLSENCENQESDTCIPIDQLSNEQVIWSGAECTF